jgi:hypothetical protein
MHVFYTDSGACVFYIPLAYLLLYITVRVRRVVHPLGSVASGRTASGRDAGFSLATCAECHVAIAEGLSVATHASASRRCNEWHVAPCRSASVTMSR